MNQWHHGNYHSDNSMSDKNITYEDIKDIVNRRHDYERFGDNDIM